MYYNIRDFDYNIESLFNDYLLYTENKRKEAKQDTNSQEYKIGKGWPDYKDVSIDKMEMPNQPRVPIEEENPQRQPNSPLTVPQTPAENFMPDENNMENGELDNNNNNNNNNINNDVTSGANDRDTELMRQLYSSINRQLYPYVLRVLDEYEYSGSPMYDEEIDRETIHQMVDRTLNLARNGLDEVGEIVIEPTRIGFSEWTSNQVLRAAIQLLLLNDIFGIRRPKYGIIRNNYVYDNNEYKGLGYYY